MQEPTPATRLKSDVLIARIRAAIGNPSAKEPAMAAHVRMPYATFHRMVNTPNWSPSVATEALILANLPGIKWEEVFEVYDTVTGEVLTRNVRDGKSEDEYSHGYRTGYRNGVKDGVELVELRAETSANVGR